MKSRIEIAGGADAEVAAAIAAVVSQLLSEEAALRATPTAPAEQSAWMKAGRMRRLPAAAASGGDASDWTQFANGDGR